jgi:D-arabinose 1-dehydrogenase-like Zn-dependent alcohol dehydrogenase
MWEGARRDESVRGRTCDLRRRHHLQGRQDVELHAAGKTHVVYERRRLEDVNSAIHEVESGQVKARLVFDL